MKLTVKHQESYSRGQLILRALFGAWYIMIPHFFLLLFLMLWGAILIFIAWWAVLFTAKYPLGFFNYQLKLRKWTLRVNARTSNMADGYPAFGLDSVDENTDIELPYPETLSRGLLILRYFFGIFYVYIPHMFLLMFRQIASSFLGFLAFWAILFTGKYPESWFNFNVGTMRWALRVDFYMSYMTDTYPPFNGKETEVAATDVV